MAVPNIRESTKTCFFSGALLKKAHHQEVVQARDGAERVGAIGVQPTPQGIGNSTVFTAHHVEQLQSDAVHEGCEVCKVTREYALKNTPLRGRLLTREDEITPERSVT